MQRPTGVVLIAALYFLGGAFAVLAGLAAFFIGGAFLMRATALGLPVSGIAGGIGTILGVILIVTGVLALIIAIGLIGMKGWARVIAMVLAAIFAVLGVFHIFLLMLHFMMVRVFFALVRVVINALILWYLNQPGVKQAFSA
jgi:hypothetical protein